MSQGLTISEAVDICYLTARRKGWWEGENNIPEKLALMHSEISEALEEYRKGYPPGHIYYSRPTTGDGPESPEEMEIAIAKPEGFGVELADCVIRIFDFCGAYGIPLEALIQQKMAYNETRPYKHGGKVC